MVNPFKRKADAQRPAVRPAPGAPALEVDSDGLEISEGNDDDDDWALWEDSVQSFDSSVMPIDPFESVGRRDK